MTGDIAFFARLSQNPLGNAFGGITAAIVALPLALAFGIASGIGPVAGLYGAMIVGMSAAMFGGTPTQISGPTGPMTIVMTAMTAHYLALYPNEGLALAFTTVVLGGAFQIAFGLMRIGKYIIMVPYPVISGFMTGIGLLIIALQLGPFLGFAAVGTVAQAMADLPQQWQNANSAAFITGGITLAVLIVWRGRVNRVLPAPLLALVVATLIASVFFGDGQVPVIGEFPSSLPTFQMPLIEFAVIKDMLVNAVMLAVLGSIDSLLTSLVADNMMGDQHDSDRELIGQGIGNVFAGLFGGLPGAGATMRTVVNIRAGGTGPLSGIIHSMVLFAAVAGLGFALESIPLAALAAILLNVGFNIIDWPFLGRAHRLPRFPVVLMLIVCLLTVFFNLLTAVIVGVFVKNLVTINRLSDLQLGELVITNGVEGAERLTADNTELLAPFAGDVTLLRITGPISYAVGRGLAQRFNQITTGQCLLIDLSNASIIGISTVLVIEQLVSKALQAGITVKLIDAPGSVRAELRTFGLIDMVGASNCSTSLSEAVQGLEPRSS